MILRQVGSWVVIVAMVSFPSCAPKHDGRSTSPVFCFESADEKIMSEYEKIAEVVIRYELQHVQLRSLPQMYFISLGDGKDPRDVFLEHLKDQPNPIRKYSDSIYENGRVTGKETGQRGIRLEVRCITRIDDNEVRVEGSWFIGHEDYQEQIFLLNKVNDKWSVKDVKGLMDT